MYQRFLKLTFSVKSNRLVVMAIVIGLALVMVPVVGPAEASVRVTITLVSGNGPVNTLDPLITLSKDGGVTFPDQASISPKHPSYAGPTPGTQYIYCAFSHSDLCGINKTHRYRQSFTLPASFTAPSLTIDIHADNKAAVFLNGVLTGLGTNFTGAPATFSTTNVDHGGTGPVQGGFAVHDHCRVQRPKLARQVQGSGGGLR